DGDETYNLYQGGNDIVDAAGGNDVFHMRAALTVDDQLNGGDRPDKVSLRGHHTSLPFVFTATTMINVEILRLQGDFNYDLTTNQATVAAGERLMINAGPLGPGNHVYFNGSAETDGSFTFYDSQGDDHFTGGSNADHIF